MTRGIEYVYLETHNWGKTVSFWQKLGFRLDLDLGRSGRLVHPDGGAAIFVEEVPPTQSLENQLYLRAARSDAHPEAPAEIARTGTQATGGRSSSSCETPTVGR